MSKRWMAVCLALTFVSVAGAEDKLIEIRARKFSYTPNIIEVNRGDHVRIRLLSEDVHHGFFLDGYEIKTSAHPGQDGHLEFVADKAGRYQFRCSVTCGEFHPYMIGYLVVQPNTRFWVAAALIVAAGLISLAILFLRKERSEPHV